MPAGLGMADHVSHFAAKSLVEPLTEAIEAIRRRGRGNAGQLESKTMGALLDESFKGGHVNSLSSAGVFLG